MNRIKGFTLTELLIIVTMVVILVMLAAGTFGPRKAGAAEVPTMRSVLTEKDVSFIYSDGDLFVIKKGTATWETPDDACAELKAVEPRLKRVVFSSGKETADKSELRWDKTQDKLTNIPEREESVCK